MAQPATQIAADAMQAGRQSQMMHFRRKGVVRIAFPANCLAYADNRLAGGAEPGD